MAAANPPDPFMDSEVGTATTDDEFQTVVSDRQVRRKKRKIREGSVDVEDLATRVDSSSEDDHHDKSVNGNDKFGNPRSKPPDLRLYIIYVQ